MRAPAAHRTVAEAILGSVGRPGAARDAFVAACQEAIDRADADLRHAICWGWTPGSARVRHYFGPTTAGPYEGLAGWLDHGPEAFASHCQGVSKKPYTPEVKTPAVKGFFEGVHRSVHPVNWGEVSRSSPQVEELLHDTFERLERESSLAVQRNKGGGDDGDAGGPGSL